MNCVCVCPCPFLFSVVYRCCFTSRCWWRRHCGGGDSVGPVVDCAVRARTETKNDTPRVGYTYFHLRCSRLLLRINPIVERTTRNRACRTNEETSVGILCVPFLLSLPIERGEPGTGTIRRSGCRLFGSCSNGERRTILLRAQQPARWIFHAQGSRLLLRINPIVDDKEVASFVLHALFLVVRDLAHTTTGPPAILVWTPVRPSGGLYRYPRFNYRDHRSIRFSHIHTALSLFLASLRFFFPLSSVSTPNRHTHTHIIIIMIAVSAIAPFGCLYDLALASHPIDPHALELLTKHTHSDHGHAYSHTSYMDYGMLTRRSLDATWTNLLGLDLESIQHKP